MPRFDGTGPLGMGPFSGRGMGYCAIRFLLSYRPQPKPSGSPPYPCGRGRGLPPCGPYGRGMGFGRQHNGRT